MTYKDPHKAREQAKKWYWENKERALAKRKEWAKNNSERVKENRRIWWENNKEEQLEHKKKYYQNNKEEIKKKNARHYRDNIDQHRDYHLKRKFGIGLNEYNLLLESQDYGCVICGTKKPGGRGNFHVDHCHKTGRVRGLLCHHCNVSLGGFRDDPTLLYNAIDYLINKKDIDGILEAELLALQRSIDSRQECLARVNKLVERI